MSTGTGIEYEEFREIADPGAGPSATERVWLDSTTKAPMMRVQGSVPLNLGPTGPLSRTSIIDPNTVVPATIRNGSPGAPYALVGAWLTALGVPTSDFDASHIREGLLVDGTLTENLTFPAYRNIELRSLTGLQLITGTASWANVAGGGAVAPTGSTLVTATAQSNILMHNIRLSGAFTITDDGTVTAGLIISNDSLATPLNILGGIVATGATKLSKILFLSARCAAITSTATSTGAIVKGYQSVFTGAITCKNLGSPGDPCNGCLFATTSFVLASGTASGIIASQFLGANPTFSGGASITMDGPSWQSFMEAGGSVTGPMVALVIGGYAGGPVRGANLTNADITVSLDGGGATAGFTTGGNYYVMLNGVLGANHTVTLGTSGAKKGDRMRIVKQDLTAVFTLTVANGGAGVGNVAILAAALKGFAEAEFDGTNWIYIGSGSSL